MTEIVPSPTPAPTATPTPTTTPTPAPAAEAPAPAADAPVRGYIMQHLRDVRDNTIAGVDAINTVSDLVNTAVYLGYVPGLGENPVTDVEVQKALNTDATAEDYANMIGVYRGISDLLSANDNAGWKALKRIAQRTR